MFIQIFVCPFCSEFASLVLVRLQMWQDRNFRVVHSCYSLLKHDLIGVCRCLCVCVCVRCNSLVGAL